jgi:hypothetical protein
MPIAGRTREQIRVSVGYNTHRAGEFIVSTTSSAGGDATSLIDNTLRGGNDVINGRWVISVEGTNDGEITRVNDYVQSSTDATVSPAFGAEIPLSMSYEMWASRFPPAAIHDFMNQAVLGATGKTFDPEVSLALFADGHQSRFDIPSEFAILRHVDYRYGVTKKEVHLCNRTFDETADSDFAQVLDDEDFKEGAGSLRLTIGSGVSAGNFITDAITEVDLSGMTHIEGWIKATTTLAASDFVIRLDSGVVQGNSTDLEILNVPATTAADTWTYFRIALDNPESDTAIVSIGLEYNANQAANTVWFDDIKGTNNDEQDWTRLPWGLWGVDRLNRDLLLKPRAIGAIGYSLLRLSGGDNPTLFSSDTTTNEIDDEYVIAYATGMALQNSDKEDERARAGSWLNIANRNALKFPNNSPYREVS